MKLYLYGNCQMPALGRMILEQHPDWRVTSCDVSEFGTIGEKEVARHLENAMAAEIVVTLPIEAYRGAEGLSTATLRAALPGRTQLISMPSIVFEGTHGAFNYLGGRLGGYFMPYHNCHSVDMALRGYHWGDVDRSQNAPDFYSAEFALAGIEASLDVLRMKEQAFGTTIKVSRILDETCRSVVMMHTINHPKRPFLARVLNEIYGAMSVPRAAREKGEDYMDRTLIPPLPTVLHHLGIPDDEPLVRAGGRSWTRPQYLRESMSYYGRLIRHDLKDALVGSRAEQFLASFQASCLLPEEGYAGVLPSTTYAFTEGLVVAAFQSLLGRPAAPEEITAHCGTMREIGITPWLDSVVASVEFQRRYRSTAE